MQERIGLQLAAQCRDRPVARIHLRLGPEPLEQALDRFEESLPVAAGQVDPTHRLLEEQVAREEPAVGVVGDVARGMTRDVDHVEAIKTRLKDVIGDLSKTIELLKAAEKEKKATLKEVESVRATLRSLQKVEL